MVFATQLRQQIEARLAGRHHSPLTLAPQLVCPGSETGYRGLDAVLRGGMPVAGTSEIIGGRSSGRTSIAAAYLAERTREGHICGWIDVAGDMSPEAGQVDGVDLDRVLWVRCAEAAPAAEVQSRGTPGMHLVASEVKTATRRSSRSVGTPGAPNRALGVAAGRVEQVATDRLPARRGFVVLREQGPATVSEHMGLPVAKPRSGFIKARRPWGRLEQAIKAVDLLVQAGGFGAIVLDLGGIAPQFARRIPLATWFRWRAVLERTRTSLVVLSQMGCTGSSAELVLRVEADLPAAGTVMLGVPYRLEVVRRRFAEESMEGRRKQPASATMWTSRATWVAS